MRNYRLDRELISISEGAIAAEECRWINLSGISITASHVSIPTLRSSLAAATTTTTTTMQSRVFHGFAWIICMMRPSAGSYRALYSYLARSRIIPVIVNHGPLTLSLNCYTTCKRQAEPRRGDGGRVFAAATIGIGIAPAETALFAVTVAAILGFLCDA